MKKVKAVFHDLGFSNSKSVALIVKSELYDKVLKTVEEKKLSQKDLVKLLKVPQPRISELMNGRISSLSIEKLISYLQTLGVATTVQFKNKAS